MSKVDAVDRFQRRHRIIGFPLAVVYKYVDDSGPYLAALITYYAFVSLFPLLLLGSTILGFVLTGNSELQAKIVNSALAQFPVVGSQLAEDPRRLGGGAVGLVVSILGSMYGGLGVAQATQYAMNTAWRVPRNVRPNPFKARGRSLLLLLTVAVGVVGTTALATAGGGVTRLGPAWNWIALGGSYALSAAIFVVVFRLATARALGASAILPGALVAALGWQLLQSFGVVFVDHIKTASATNGVFALVLGLLAFLYVTSVMIVICVEINVVRVEKLYPRALLTPFTDNVRLTVGDRRAYTTQAEAQRSKGFERVDVSFDDDADRTQPHESPQTESMQTESMQTEPPKTGSMGAESMQAGSMGAESMEAESMHRGPRQTKPAPNEPPRTGSMAPNRSDPDEATAPTRILRASGSHDNHNPSTSLEPEPGRHEA